MYAAELELPALFIKKPVYRILRRHCELCESTAYALKSEQFTDARLVDARGRVHRIRGARKVRGIGPFRGWNLFLNQRIEVDLDLELEQEQVELEDLKRWIREAWAAWDGWASGGDLPEKRAALKRATTLADVMEAIREKREQPPTR